MGRVAKYTRRAFMGLGVLAAGGVAVGYYLYQRPYENPLEAQAAEGDAVFNPYLTIAADGSITIIAPRAEMGQGISTTLAMLVAEELDADPDQITVIHGPASSAYFNGAMLTMGGPFPWFIESFAAEATRTGMAIMSKFLGLQVTGGSSATIDGYEKMRAAGAAAREALKLAAAERWGVSAKGLATASAKVTNPATGDSLSYAELATEAAGMRPRAVALRDPSEWRLLGKPQVRVDGLAKVTGAPIFGIDVELPDMVHATVKISPRFGAGWKSYDDSAALAVPGVEKVVPIETQTGKGFGILANTTWAAFQGAEALEVDWEDAPYPASSDGMTPLYDAALKAEPSFELGGTGDAPAAISEADPGDVVEADYTVPFLAHATMEPMNATAQLKDGKLDIWAGHQGPGIVEMVCAKHLGMETEDVTCHVMHLGGGFGRRGEVDYPLYATALAAEADGRPVKVTWSREEDMRHGVYRPRAAAKMRGVVKDGKVEAFDAMLASPSLMSSVMTRAFPNFPAPPNDEPLLDGMFNQPLDVPHARYAGSSIDLPIPLGFWRSVGNSFNGYFHQCFVDELAEKAGADPIAFRLDLMADPRHAPGRACLEKVAEMSGWGAELPEGKGQGVAHVLSFGTWVAEVVQVDVTDGLVRIEKVWAAADPGRVLDPGIFEAQMVSGINFGLSQALGQAITFENGEVVQGNFDSFDAMRMWQVPEIEVAFLETAPKMGGAGEVGTPPAPAALANAIYAATGQRLRAMPFSDYIDFA